MVMFCTWTLIEYIRIIHDRSLEIAIYIAFQTPTRRMAHT